jgi:adenosylhomocysteine nucleosidase
MRLGIVAAFDFEARMFMARAGPLGRPDEDAGDPLVALAGMGAARARAAGERLLNDGATALVSWGVAAGLDRALSPGSLVAPRAIIAADLSELPVSTDLHRTLCERLGAGFVIHTDPLAESAKVLTTPAQKRALLLRSGAIAADMESAALAAVAREAQVPFLAVRAISDAAAVSVPSWLVAAMDGAGRLAPAQLLKQIVLRPLEWAAVSRLALGFRAARATLKHVAAKLGAARQVAW